MDPGAQHICPEGKQALSKYRIQTVAQMTGLSPALIRAWEARYRLLSPQRSASGYRLYSEEDVALLRAVQRRIEGGMAPMEAAALGRSELLGTEPAAPAAPAAEAPPAVTVDDLDPPAPQGPREPQVIGLFSERIDQIIAAFARFDRARAEELLGPPLASLPPEIASEHLLVPLLVEVGDRWHHGELSVAAEHFGSSLIRGKLLAILETMRHRAGSRRILCACPSGERHEIGLMAFALRAASQGWDAIYLGADLPASGLGEAAERTRPELAALSITRVLPEDELRRLLEEARAALPVTLPLLVGGRGVVGLERAARRAGALLLPRSGLLGELLAAPAALAVDRRREA